MILVRFVNSIISEMNKEYKKRVLKKFQVLLKRSMEIQFQELLC